MNFDDHAIWDMPVPEKGAPVEPQPVPVRVEARTEAGRIYRSARVTGHPEAILALAERRQQSIITEPEPAPAPVAAPAVAPAAVAPATAAAAETPAVQPEPVEPAAAADAPVEADLVPESVAQSLPEPAPAAADPFGGSFDQQDDVLDLVVRETGSTLPPAAATPVPPTAAVPMQAATERPSLITIRSNAAQMASDAKEQLAALNDHVQTASYDARRVALYLFIPTALAAIGEAVISDMLGLVTGAVLTIVTVFLALKVDAQHAWTTQVLPAFVLIAAILVGGQFAVTAPGMSPLGQIMLVVTSCITLAPWLAAATVLGAVVPRVRHRNAAPALDATA